MLFRSIRESTAKKYEPHIQRWILFAKENQEDPLKPRTQTALNYLSDLFDKGASYTTIVAAKCAISSFISFDKDKTFGNLPIVIKLLKGIYESRPSLPYKSRVAKWDPMLVINKIKDWFPHEDIQLKLLTLKLCILLAFTSGQRVQTLSSLRVEDIQLNQESCFIFIQSLLKTSKKGVQQRPIELVKFSQQNLCTIDVLKTYLYRTESLRKGTKLFISYQRPHKDVSTETLSRWIKQVLESVGIKSTAHSTRSLSTSLAADHGLPIQEILNAAGWQSDATFAKFYKIRTSENFGAKVINR